MRVVAVLSPVGSALFSSVAAVILRGRCSAPPQFLFCVIVVVSFVLGPHAVEERMSQCFPCCDATLRLIIQELAEQIVEIGVLFSDGILYMREFLEICLVDGGWLDGIRQVPADSPSDRRIWCHA